MAGKLELTWYGKENRVAIEPRILIENKELSNIEHDVNTENMLIHGDNLLALKALEQTYVGKIKCIYIDPPYNTGAAFEHYDDNLEHSIWLSLMRERLIMLKNLLSINGVIFIQIDDNEQAYLKVLCDEVFGRKNFVNCIAIKMSPSSGVKRRFANIKFIKNKEYILVYKKQDIQLKPINDEIKEYDVNYTIYFDGEEFCPISEKLKAIDPAYDKISADLYLRYPKIKKFIIDNKDKIWRRHSHSKWASGLMTDENLIFVKYKKYIPRSRVWKIHNPNNSEEYEIIMNTRSGYERLEPISWKFIDDKMTLLRGDFWEGYESDMGNVSKEGKNGKLIFGEGQKPERLIKDIINCCTDEGDWVLDSFLGSGTTCAVAHKLNRKYIGIEMGEQAYRLVKPRIDFIISGNDQTGISNLVNWQGGGGYRFYELAPTLIKEDDFGQEIINPEYNKEMLSAAVALHEGYQYDPDDECYWKQAKNNNSYLYVTTQHIKREHIERIKLDIKEGEFLLVVCKSFESNCIQGEKNIIVKKIPQSLLKNCEFNKDNYNLNIINPPLYEEGEDE